MSNQTDADSVRLLAMYRLQLALAHTLKKHEPELFDQVVAYMDLFKLEAQRANKPLLEEEIETVIRGLRLQLEAPVGVRRSSLSIVPSPPDKEEPQNQE